MDGTDASMHMTRNREWLDVKEPPVQNIKLANSKALIIKSCGKVNITIKIHDETKQIRVRDIIYVPDLSSNLLSVSRILKSGCKVQFNDHGCTITNPMGQKVAETYLGNDVYKLATQTKTVACLVTSNQDSYVWHQRLGHLSLPSIKRLNQMHAWNKIVPEDARENYMHILLRRQAYPFIVQGGGNRATQTLELIHSNLCGPMENKSLGNSRYFITFIGDFSRKVFVYFMEDKTDVLSKFKKFKALMENKLNKTIKAIRTDSGKEYINHAFKNYLIQEGIVHHTTNPYSPEQNGSAERMNRTLIKQAKCMLTYLNFCEQKRYQQLPTLLIARQRNHCHT